MRRRTEQGLWIVGGLAASVTFCVAAPKPVSVPTVIGPHTERTVMTGAVDGRLTSARAQRIAQRNPFRLTRRQYDPGLVAEPEQAVSTAMESEPSPIRQLVLAGVAGGPPWVAVIDHVPGLPGSGVLHVGDTLAGFIVLRIAPDTLVLRHGDTTVVLTPRQTWP